MAITLGTPTNSGNLASSTGTTLSHTTVANTKALVVIITGYDSSAVDSVVNSVTFNSIPLTQCRYYRSGSGFIAIWYRPNPYIGTYDLTVTMAGANTDLQVTAIGLLSSTTNAIIYNTYAEGTNTSNLHSLVINPARTGSVALGGIVDVQAATTALSVSVGSEIAGSEADMGSQVVGCAASSVESGGQVVITWLKSAAASSYALMCSFYEQFIPTVALDSPNDLATGISTIPTLTFTGTDANADAIEYHLQLDTVNTFSSTIAGFDLKYADLRLSKAGTPTDNLTIEIRSSIDGSAIGISDIVLSASLPTIESSYTRFTFASPISLSVSTKYYIILKRSSAYDTLNSIRWWASDLNPINGGGTSSKNSGVWSNESTIYDCQFILYDTNTEIKISQTQSTATTIIMRGSGGSGEEISQSFVCNSTVPAISKLSATDTGFSSGHPYASGTQQSYTFQSALTENTTYYWRVRAIDPTGSNTYGPWSAVRSFTTFNRPPTVALDSPADLSTGVSQTPTFQFTGTDLNGDALEYNLEILNVPELGVFEAISQSGSWYGVSVNPNTGDVYASINIDGIYKQTAGSGSFVKILADNSKPWRKISVNPTNGDVYVCAENYDVYKQTAGTGNFVALNATGQARAWIGVCVNPTNGDVYACVYQSDIYKQTAGTGNFVALNATGQARAWQSVTVNPTNGDVYAAVGYGVIYKQTAGTGNFVAITTINGYWNGISVNPATGDVYACQNNSKIYKQTAGTGNFVAITGSPQPVYDVAFNPLNGDLYCCVYGGYVYKQTNSPVYSKLSTIDLGFSAGHPYTSGTQQSYTLSTELVANTTYYWRVQAIDPSGSNTYGPWSEVRSFTTLSGVVTSALKAINDVLKASIASVNSLAMTAIKSINGINN